MGKCEVCGNDYDMTFEIHVKGAVHTYDCFECAIQGLAPKCEHCACRIIGHGVEASGHWYCCAHCAREKGISDLVDRVGAAAR